MVPDNPDGQPLGLDDKHPTNRYQPYTTCRDWQLRCFTEHEYREFLRNERCRKCEHCETKGILYIECWRCTD